MQATGVTSWRPEGIKYKKNEVYIDVIESVYYRIYYYKLDYIIGQRIVKLKGNCLKDRCLGRNQSQMLTI